LLLAAVTLPPRPFGLPRVKRVSVQDNHCGIGALFVVETVENHS